MQNIDELYITDYAGWVYFSPAAARYFGDRFDLWEWCDSMALIPSESGCFRLCDTKLGRFATWERFAGLLKSRYPIHEGYFKLASVPVHRSDYPKHTVALVFRPKGPITDDYSFVWDRRVRTDSRLLGHGFVKNGVVTVFIRGAQTCAKRLSVLTNGDVFAFIANRKGEFFTEKSFKNGNHFLIRHPALADRIRTVESEFSYVWRFKRVFFMTNKPELFRTVQSLDSYTPIAFRTTPLKAAPSRWRESS